MKRIKDQAMHDSSGEIMLESILVIIPILFVLVFLICLGFYFYQHWNIQITANETASKVAESYQYLSCELGTGVSSYGEVKDVNLYRYGYWKDKYEATNISRGRQYMKKYLSLVSLAYPKSTPKMNIRKVNDGLFERHIEVELEGTYRLPFSEGFAIFGFAEEFHYSAAGYAVCTDLIDYMGTVNYAANLEGLLHLKDISLYKALNSITGMISSVANAIDHFTK